MITKVEFAIFLLFQDPWQITWLICWNIFSDILSQFRSAITLGIHHQVIIVYLPATINGKTSSARKVFMLFWSFWADVNCDNIAFWCRINPNRPQAISQFKNFYLTISRKYPQLNPAPSGGLLSNFQDWKNFESCFDRLWGDTLRQWQPWQQIPKAGPCFLRGQIHVMAFPIWLSIT